jgi:pseudouridine-5'-phosphate glycosidase
MANSASHASLPYPIRGARFSLLIPFLDADGDPTDPTTPDTEVSKDAGAFADCAEEITTISGTNGMGYITLSGSETDAAMCALAAKVASGPKATLATLYPRQLAVVESGTAQAGAAGTITLAAGAAAFNLTGCFVKTTGGTGGGGTGGANNQARKIVSYNATTKVATIAPNWETNPDATTTYEVLLPEGLPLVALWAMIPTVLGRSLDVTATGEAGIDLANIGSPTVNLRADVRAINNTTVTGNGAGTPWGPV